MTAKRFLPVVTAALAAAAATAARATPVLTTLASFDGPVHGANPYSGLIADAAGNLYGTTNTSGTNVTGNGTVFELTAASGFQTIVTLAAIPGTGNGFGPYAGLAIDSAGNLYGTSAGGGTANDGTVFELSGANHQTFTTLVSFTGANGSSPHAGLTIDPAGNLYGTTYTGGTGSGGTVFKLAAANRAAIVTLANLNASGGSFPIASVTLDGAGNLFGTTTAGGDNGNGAAYEVAGIATATPTYAKLASFNTATTGAGPQSTLVFDAAGTLYGTTSTGGPTGTRGSVFSLSGTNHQTLTTLATFAGATGTAPQGNLTIDADGNLYGTTVGGGAGGNGTVYSVTGANHQTITPLAAFNSANGSLPYGTLLPDASGRLFGTTINGGANANGSAFVLANTGFVLPVVTVAANASTSLVVPVALARVGLLSLSGVTLNDGATITFAKPTGTGGTAASGLVQVGMKGVVIPHTREGTISTGLVNLGGNDADVPNNPSAGNTLGSTTAEAAQGYNGGNWNGSGGIADSAAAADPKHVTALGVIANNQSAGAVYSYANTYDGIAPGATDLLIKHTYYGDANLDGLVNGADYGRLDAGYASGGALTGWYNGDFNYDGRVDGSDYSLADNAFDEQGPPLATTAAVVAAVPEPAAGTAAAVGLALLVRRRRARR